MAKDIFRFKSKTTGVLESKQKQENGTISEVEAKRLAEQKQSEIDAKNAKIHWMRTVTNAELLEKFADFTLRLEVVPHEPVSVSFKQVKKAWFAVDRNLLTDDNALSMYEVLTVNISLAVVKYCANSVVSGLGAEKAWSAQYPENDDNPQKSFQKAYFALDKLFRTQDEAAILARNARPTLKKRINGFSNEFSNLDSELSLTANRLEKLWMQASANSNTVEDEYFLEQVKESYLPEAWELYKTVQFAPEAIKTQAQNVLLKQFDVIEKHILGILEVHLNYSIDAMRSQLRFLENKTVQPGTNSLALKPALKEVTA